MSSAKTGDVVLYAYLWAREHQRGEESGRKARPACVMVLFKHAKGKETTLLFPITSQKPLPRMQAVEIPETEARRARLYSPAWIIVSEFNTDNLDSSFALEDREPLGTFSSKFMSMVAARAAAAVRAGASRSVPRT
jgi:hypothetical protein